MMPRRRRDQSEGVVNLNLTPLLDVVLQLITFFMMLIHFGSRLEGATKAVRLKPPGEVMFPVTPMLDMAFQLLAFFVRTFPAPSAETQIDRDLPATPLALPGAPRGNAEPPPARRVDTDLENDLFVRVEAD